MQLIPIRNRPSAAHCVTSEFLHHTGFGGRIWFDAYGDWEPLQEISFDGRTVRLRGAGAVRFTPAHFPATP